MADTDDGPPPAMSWKAQKEAFVSGHEGTTIGEVYLICATAPIGYWFCAVLQRSFSQWVVARPVTLEAMAFWIPMILCQSTLQFPWGMGYILLQLFIILILEIQLWRKNQGTSSTTPSTTKTPQHDDSSSSSSLHFLTTYRSSMLYLTFVAILAVDFPLFPRRLAKTETQGYSLMDVGAASFVIAAGLVSSRARRRRNKTNTSSSSFSKTVYRSLPLLILGLLRLATHKGIDYHEHASEYGIHWNFNFTLALIPLLVRLFPAAGSPSIITPLVLLTVYQVLLSHYGLQEWIETSPRTCAQQQEEEEELGTVLSNTMCHLFAANREGILGCIGYSSLYMMGEWVGSLSLWADSSRKISLWILCLPVFFFWNILVHYWEIPVSRRSTNAPFCFWALLVNLPLLAFMKYIHQVHQQVSVVSYAVNRHGLIAFVVANLLTGAVNLSVNTLQANDGTACAILIAYMTAIGVLCLVLDALMGPKEATKTSDKRD